MASKYENQEKIICGLLYNSHQYDFEFDGAKYKKLRVTTIIGNIIYEYWMGAQTWKNGSESKNSSFDKDGWRFSKFFKAIGTIKEIGKKVIETFVKNEKNIKQCLLPTIWEPIEKDFIGRTLPQSEEYMLNELQQCDTIKDVHRWYKKYAKYYHPDFLKRELFPDEQITFEVITEARNDGCELIRQFNEVFND